MYILENYPKSVKFPYYRSVFCFSCVYVHSQSVFCFSCVCVCVCVCLFGSDIGLRKLLVAVSLCLCVYVCLDLISGFVGYL